MALLSRDQIIKEYYEKKVKDKYPHVTLEQCQDVCKLPFDGIVEWLRAGTLPFIRIPLFGKILINERRVHARIKRLDERYEQGKITDEYYNTHRTKWVEYLKELQPLTNRELKKKVKEFSKQIVLIDDVPESPETNNQ